MACDVILQKMAEAQRKREEERRKRELRKIEDALARGSAQIVKQPDGSFRIVGAELPRGMYDLCVLAKLQERQSDGFRKAMMKAQAQAMNFIHQHNLSHLRGGHRH